MAGSQLRALVDLLLTQASIGYFPKGYISEQVLPVVTHSMSSGKIGSYGKEYLRIENTVKGGRGKYRRVDVSVTNSTSFYIQGHGLEDIITKEDYKNKMLPFDAEKDKTIGLTHMLYLEKEQIVANALSDTSVITQNVTLAGSQQYSDYLNSDPIADFNTARATIIDACGFPPNTAIMDYKVWNVLRFHPAMLDALGFKWAQPGGLSVDQLSTALGVEKLLIGNARYNSAKEGQTDSLSAVWGKNIVFAVIPDSAQVQQVSLGYMVRYDGEGPRRVYKYPENNPPESNVILVEDNYDALLTQPEAAYLIKSAIA